jgi:hypothetical protein
MIFFFYIYSLQIVFKGIKTKHLYISYLKTKQMLFYTKIFVRCLGVFALFNDNADKKICNDEIY